VAHHRWLAGRESGAACSAIVLAKILGASRQVTLSLAPKSVTTPIAMGISEKIGGLPSLTAVLVITTGVIGAVLGPWFLDRLGIDDPTIRGTAMGTARTVSAPPPSTKNPAKPAPSRAWPWACRELSPP
jgi:putative effector of murein hydrolase